MNPPHLMDSRYTGTVGQRAGPGESFHVSRSQKVMTDVRLCALCAVLHHCQRVTRSVHGDGGASSGKNGEHFARAATAGRYGGVAACSDASPAPPPIALAPKRWRRRWARSRTATSVGCSTTCCWLSGTPSWTRCQPSPPTKTRRGCGSWRGSVRHAGTMERFPLPHALRLLAGRSCWCVKPAALPSRSFRCRNLWVPRRGPDPPLPADGRDRCPTLRHVLGLLLASCT